MPVIQIQHRYDTAANWASANPVLLAGEFGLDTTIGRVKLGDGTTAWNSLAYQHTRILSGAGAPAGGLGVDGDFYIMTTEPRLYGPKTAGAWGSGITMVGPQGIQGNQGVTGAGVPTGGTGGQYLTKIDGTNYNTQWSTLDLSGKFDRQNGTLVGVASPTYAAGKLVYDTDNECPTFFNNDSNVALNIGQETWIRVRNVSGSTITNGAAVYISGANTGLPTIALARADSATTANCVGLATESIANNGVGYVTTLGVVRGLNTASFAAGAVVYLDAASAGALTATRPSAPNFSQRVGMVVVSDVSVGTIHVQPAGTGLGLGSANYLLGMNSGATAQEYKQATTSGLSWLTLANAAAQTAALDVASTSLKGLMSAADKVLVDNVHYDVVADFGWVGNDSTDNLAAFNAMIAAAPAGAVFYFPPGTYRVSGELNINVDKRFTFKGANRYASIIKTTSATANIFHKSVAGWYDMWLDLGFQSSVTKTAGAAISISAGNNVGMNVYRCWFTGMFQSINATGAQSANLSVWADLDISAVTNGGRGIVINGNTINVMITNVTINAGAATTSACCEINQSGAVQVVGCDWIQGTNVVLLNSTAGAGPQAVYFTNCFFDQPQATVIRIYGPNTANRIKFTQCGIATATSGFHGIEVAGSGAGAVGSQTALPGGISVVDCDIYHQAGSSTGSGIYVAGCQDINIQNSRIAGYNGAGGSAIRIIPSSGNQTKFRINGNILGPNSNLTLTNTVGVQIDAGSSGPAVMSITDNTMTGCTTAIVDSSTAFADQQKNINNNAGAVSGFSAQAVPNSTALTTTETVVMVVPIPPNSLKVGTTFKALLNHKPGGATTSVTTVRFRIGTSAVTPATNTALIAVADSSTATNTTKFMTLQGAVTAIGASATFMANGCTIGGAVAFASTNTAASATFNSTVQNYLMVTVQSGTSNTLAIYTGSMEIISPS